MNCKSINKNLLSYLDGEMDKVSEKNIRDHLQICNTCQIALEKLKEVYLSIDLEKKAVETNAFMAQKVWDKIHNSHNLVDAPIIPMRRLTLVTLVAAGLALGIAVGSLLNSSVHNNKSDVLEQSWTQLADDYFPTEFYSPYEELNSNE